MKHKSKDLKLRAIQFYKISNTSYLRFFQCVKKKGLTYKELCENIENALSEISQKCIKI